MATRPLVPTDVNAGGWYDGSDAASITLVSNAVSQWSDKSGNARHVVQNNPTYRPSVVANALNGKSAISFVAANLITPTQIALPQPLAVIAIFQNSAGNLFNITFDGSQDYSGGRCILFNARSDRNNAPAVNAGNGSQQIGSTVTNAGPFILTGAWDNTGTVGALNGTVATGSSPGANGVLKGYAIGGDPSTANNYMNATLCELVLLTATTPATLRQMEGYLAWKWGQQGLLPANHPYKAAAPTVTDGATDSRTGASTATAKAVATGSGAKSGRGVGADTARAISIGTGSKASAGSSIDTAVGSALAAGRKASSGAGASSALATVTGSGAKASASTSAASPLAAAVGTGSKASLGTGSSSARSVATATGRKSTAGQGTSAGIGTGTGTNSGVQQGAGTGAASAAGSLLGTGRKSARGASVSSAAASASGVGRRALAGTSRATTVGLAIAAGSKGSVGLAALIATGRASGFNGQNAFKPKPILLRGVRSAPASLQGTRQKPAVLIGRP